MGFFGRGVFYKLQWALRHHLLRRTWEVVYFKKMEHRKDHQPLEWSGSGFESWPCHFLGVETKAYYLIFWKRALYLFIMGVIISASSGWLTNKMVKSQSTYLIQCFYIIVILCFICQWHFNSFAIQLWNVFSEWFSAALNI